MMPTEPLHARYHRVRGTTAAILADADPEDLCAQSMPDASPGKWHLAHTTWFFARFVLDETTRARLATRELFGADADFLFNSYYEAVGDRQARPARGLMTRPNLGAVLEYRRRVDEAMSELIASSESYAPVLATVELGLAHEEQHQELMLTDLCHLFGTQVTSPVLRPAPISEVAQSERDMARVLSRASAESSDASGLAVGRETWLRIPEGVHQVGHNGSDFHFDNEGPRHSVYLAAADLAADLVSNAEWLAFIDDGGYQRPELWLSEGWEFVRAHQITAPQYWRRRSAERRWRRYCLHGELDLNLRAPVSHVSYFEADAFARWRGARLPTEFEWEVGAALFGAADRAQHPSPRETDNAPVDRRLSGWLMPQSEDLRATRGVGVTPPHAREPGLEGSGVMADQARQLFGEVWQWTSSAYLPYPAFRPAPGAVGEYNGKFMINQQVLRGGSCFTAPGHSRASYRNFFPTNTRWQMAGLRLARDHD